MVRINKVYTGVGDGGQTQLVGGKWVAKHDVRVECLGTLDELNSALGLVLAFAQQQALQKQKYLQASLKRALQPVQQRLFDLGAELATPATELQTTAIKQEDVAWLEAAMDSLNESLPPLESFVLPGGGMLAAQLHLARTVCRRAERCCVRLYRETEGEAALEQPEKRYSLVYLNRLSDWLFVLARWVAHQEKEAETLWQPRQTTEPFIL